jgi:two-component system LytT family response regulator
MPLKTLIVDDESLARKLLSDYVSKVPELELVGTCEDALQARAVLQAQAVDLMLLDIEMPELTGLELLKSLAHPPLTILTTAYEQYALKGYELQVLDYLLKPIPFDRFVAAIDKAVEYHQLQQQGSPDEPPKDYFFIKADYKIQKVFYDDILYIEGMREYVRIHLSDRRITVRQAMSRLDERLPSAQFMRIHRSYIINLRKLESLQPHSVKLGDQELPVSKSYWDALVNRIEKDQLF